MCSERMYIQIDAKTIFNFAMRCWSPASGTTPLTSQLTHAPRDPFRRSTPRDGLFFDPEPRDSSQSCLAFDARKHRSSMLFCVGSADAVIEHEKHARARVDDRTHSSPGGKLEQWYGWSTSRSGVKLHCAPGLAAHAPAP